MFFYRFSLTSSRSFIKKDYLETTTIVPLIDQIVLSTEYALDPVTNSQNLA